MRIDPKYFNRFIGICAAITVVVIIYSTIRYSQNQAADFETNVMAIQADTLSFQSFSRDSLFLRDISNQPVIIHFWSTWSDKSKEVNQFLKTYSENHENLFVIAAEVRDSNEKVSEYIDQNEYPFQFVEGSDLFHALRVPGIPSQIFINQQTKTVDTHVGNDTLAIKKKLDRLLSNE